MQDVEFSRRAFAHLVGAGAALAAFPLAAKTTMAAGPVRLSANENPYGPSPAALRAIQDALGLAARYPDEAQDKLVETIAASHGLSTSEILLGDGSSEILKVVSAAFTGPGRAVVMADPTFEPVAMHAKLEGADVVRVPLDSSFAHDLGRMVAVRGVGLHYICNPNNPTATITPKDKVREFIENASGSAAILVDEAYFHYAETPSYESVVPMIREHPNLIVSRTFSKIYGMAGLRCGYCVAQKEMIEKLSAQQAFDTMNIVALAAANASLLDRDLVPAARKRNSDTRRWVSSAVGDLGFEVLPSEANFVMIDLGRDVKPVIAGLRDRGVRVGRFFPALPQHVRVTIGKPEEMQRFVTELARVVS